LLQPTAQQIAGMTVGGLWSQVLLLVLTELPLKSVGQWVGSVVKMAAQSYSDVT
jgi:DNA mismatch repair protein MutH